MGQLSSPPVSARAFTTWLVESMSDPDKPLATMSLLLSEPNGSVYRHPRSTEEFPVASATMDNVIEAVREWKTLGDADSDNRLIFFFCGHGIAQGADTSLLLADYGTDSNDPLSGAIDFRRFHLGMNTCAAHQQCYFVDACRSSSDTLIEALGYAGRPIIRPDTRHRRADGPREAPIYYSTIAGEDAYGRPDALSPFTDALLRGLNGAAGDDSEGDWRVSTTRLKEAIDYFLKRQAAGRGGCRFRRPPSSPRSISITWPITRGAGDDLLRALRCARRGRAQLPARRRAGDQADSGKLPVGGAASTGSYEFAAEFSEGPYVDATARAYVRPVYRKVPLKVLR